MKAMKRYEWLWEMVEELKARIGELTEERLDERIEELNEQIDELDKLIGKKLQEIEYDDKNGNEGAENSKK